MKFSTFTSSVLAASLLAGSAVAAGKVSNEAKSDAEYMMRKIVEDIHERSLRMVVTDITLDKSIHVVGKAVKFIPSRKDKRTGEDFSCARVVLNTQIFSGEKVAEKINRTDEICTGKKSGSVKYVANIN
ncbi:hypothetical protein [Sneathiella glossodoripedis]|uniref:hypothetical protein n=1 Tax=Sneathiella glossodoripedis TaxID=418853 RepID=UPI000471020B|nr:hypothetical protein [Sneathiella glossodoripedis]